MSAPPDGMDRRTVLSWAIGGIAAGVTALVGVPLVAYFGAASRHRLPRQWVRVCSLAEVPSDEPKHFQVSFRGEEAPIPYDLVRGVFVIRRGADVLAFSNICTHMHCAVRWLDWREQIYCPCHGGVYDRWGFLVGGPPESSLPLFVQRVEGSDLFIANETRWRPPP